MPFGKTISTTTKSTNEIKFCSDAGIKRRPSASASESATAPNATPRNESRPPRTTMQNDFSCNARPKSGPNGKMRAKSDPAKAASAIPIPNARP